jgi:hypothetical protein
VLVVLLLLLRLALRRLEGLQAVALLVAVSQSRKASRWRLTLVPALGLPVVALPVVALPVALPVAWLVAQLRELQVWDGVN